MSATAENRKDRIAMIKRTYNHPDEPTPPLPHETVRTMYERGDSEEDINAAFPGTFVLSTATQLVPLLAHPEVHSDGGEEE